MFSCVRTCVLYSLQVESLYIVVYCGMLWYIVIRCGVLWYIVVHCGILWYVMFIAYIVCKLYTSHVLFQHKSHQNQPY